MATSVGSSYPASSPSLSVSSALPCRCRTVRWQHGGAGVDGRRRHSATVLSCARKNRGRDVGGELVDEDVVVLRRRIYELRKAEAGEGGPPSHWMEWEKQHHGVYSAAVCDMVVMLQRLLMETRPSVALGVAAVVAVGVPASAVVVALRLVGLVEVILRGGLVRW